LKILLLGNNGQLGQQLQRTLSILGQVIAPPRASLDLCQTAQVIQYIQEIKPEWIVNAAAYTDVDGAEQQSALAFLLNSHLVEVLAEQALAVGAWLIHYSTDYVFDGNQLGAYTEQDSAAPLSVYGASKLAGEQAILNSGCQHLIFRLSWLYANTGNNFAHTMLKLAQQQTALTVVADQVGAPTSARLVAAISAQCMQQLAGKSVELGRRQSGVYHLTAEGVTNWHQYSVYLLTQAQKLGVNVQTPSSAITPILAADYPSLAVRPKNSRLCCDKIKMQFSLILPQWQQELDLMLPELIHRLMSGDAR
jgi:dTDP-4-dehydrorhamnose reductase